MKAARLVRAILKISALPICGAASLLTFARLATHTPAWRATDAATEHDPGIAFVAFCDYMQARARSPDCVVVCNSSLSRSSLHEGAVSLAGVTLYTTAVPACELALSERLLVAMTAARGLNVGRR